MLFRKLRAYFFTGLLIILPIIVSLYIITFLFIKATDYIFSLFPSVYYGNIEIKILVRVVALGLLVATLILIGMFGRNFIGRRLLHYGETLFIKIPLLGRIYIAVKQVSEAFLSFDKKNILSKVCLIEYPRKGIMSLGFITSRSEGEVQYRTEKKVISVFVPTTPNPTSGILVFVPEEEIVPLQMTIEEGLKMVISGGAVTPQFDPKNDIEPTVNQINK
ncbi:DUF502 domain-containing protein [bacterium]|nr:DUF502 domain-containing protein [bacterium]MCP5462097.1 DUF502 domain-containing protein [bacterium]